jgi:hypothetical protein
MRGTIVGLVVLVAGLAAATEQRPAYSGSWIATGGTQVFRGTWSARALPNDANSAVGSWTMAGESGEMVMQGTWSAKKAPRAWRGTWQAKVLPSGGTYSGTWQAAITADFKGKTFEDLLQAGAAQQMSGVWRMGRAGGNWWLKALEQ